MGILELLFGLPMLLSPQKTVHWMQKALKDDLWMRTIGALFLILCFFVLLENPDLGPLPTKMHGLVKLFAWMGALKGLLYCWYPDLPRDARTAMLAKSSIPFIGGLAATIIGILLLLYAPTL